AARRARCCARPRTRTSRSRARGAPPPRSRGAGAAARAGAFPTWSRVDAHPRRVVTCRGSSLQVAFDLALDGLELLARIAAAREHLAERVLVRPPHRAHRLDLRHRYGVRELRVERAQHRILRDV